MQKNFDVSLVGVLAHEGGYVNNPADPGGPTNKGVTIATARLYISPSFTIAQLRSLTNAQAGIIYRKQYADKVRFDELPSGVDYAAFDYAVNSGPGRPRAVLRALVGTGSGNGPLDDVTMRAIAARDPAKVINAICDERLRFMMRLKTWSTFGKGWQRRVDEVRKAALRLAVVSAMPPSAQLATPPVPQAVAPAQGKAMPSAATGSATPSTAAAGAATGTVIAAQSAFHFPAWGVAILAIVGLAIVIGVAVYVVRRNEAKHDEPAPGTSVIPLAA